MNLFISNLNVDCFKNKNYKYYTYIIVSVKDRNLSNKSPNYYANLFSGELFLDNGEKLVIKNMLGHAEDIYWRW